MISLIEILNRLKISDDFTKIKKNLINIYFFIYLKTLKKITLSNIYYKITMFKNNIFSPYYLRLKI